jgi:hypothetical protein
MPKEMTECGRSLTNEVGDETFDGCCNFWNFFWELRMFERSQVRRQANGCGGSAGSAGSESWSCDSNHGGCQR